MAITVTIADGSPALASSISNQTMNYTVTVANTNAASVVLQALSIVPTSGDAIVSQPNYLTPNVPVGVGNPVIPSGASVSYGFQAVWPSPTMPGPSPQAPGGAAAVNAAAYPENVFQLIATSQTSDGTIASNVAFVPVITKEFPQSSGGALVLSQGFNIVNLLTL